MPPVLLDISVIMEQHQPQMEISYVQLVITVQRVLVYRGLTIPQCIKSLLAEKAEEKFPIFNRFVDDLPKLVDELALIKKILNNQ